MAGFLSELFGDRSSQYNEYAKQMRQIGEGYNPYIERGREAGDLRYGQAQDLINDPNGLQNRIAAGYEQSPYQKMLLDETTQRFNNNAANTGMIQSPLVQEALNKNLNTMTSQFLNDYIGRGIGSYGAGMGILNDIDTQGYNSLGLKNQYLQGGASAQLSGANSAQDAMNNLIGTGIGGLASWATGGFSNMPGFLKGDFWAPQGGGMTDTGGGFSSDFGYP